MCQKLPIAQLKEFSDMWMRTIKDGGGGGLQRENLILEIRILRTHTLTSNFLLAGQYMFGVGNLVIEEKKI